MSEEIDDTSARIMHFVAAATAAARTLTEQHGLPIEYRHVQEALEDRLNVGRSEDLIHLPLTQADILAHLKDYKFGQFFPVVLTEISLDQSIIPIDTLQRLEERTIRVHGEVWRIHKNDADPFPSNHHGHNLESGHKLHLGTGELFLKKKLAGKIHRKDLLVIREKLADVQLPPLPG